MNFYYYLFSCAYWYSTKDMKENSSPQEYALIFISIVDLFFSVILMGLLNIAIGHNILNGGIIISVSLVIVVINYLIFLKSKKYLIIVETFKNVSSQEFKSKRQNTLILTFIIVALIAIIVSIFNNQDFKSWLFQ